MFLDWRDSRGVQIICCGDPGQLPPTAGVMPHSWLRQMAEYYEEIDVDHRAKDDAMIKSIRLKADKMQCQEMRMALHSCLGWTVADQ